MIDTHCHLTFKELGENIDRVLADADEAGVDRMITVGTTPEDVPRARDIAEAHGQVFFSSGVHPHYAQQVALNQLPALAELAVHARCVAFGEMGLDYHYADPPPAPQHELFQAQLEMIRYSELIKPVIIHCRKAFDDVLSMIAGSGIDERLFVFHCFTGTPDEAKRVLDIGAMISFTGIVTYKNAKDVQEAAKLVPDDRIMIETDAPYLAPEPHRKVRPNEPRLVPHVARFLAELRGTSFEDFVSTADANAERFFGLERLKVIDG